MNLPDRATAVVRSDRTDATLRFIAYPHHQPQEAGVIHAHVAGIHADPVLNGLIRFRNIGGQWHEEGPAPSPRDASWHPDLDDHIGESIDIARTVLSQIPRGRSIEIFPVTSGTSDSGWKVRSTAMFNLHLPGAPSQPYGIAEDADLDPIPMVRRVERIAEPLCEILNIKAHDDGSGVEENLLVTVSPDALSIELDDGTNGIKLVLSSSRTDGEWTHSTTLILPADQDPMATLRSKSDPIAALWSYLDDDLEGDTRWHAVLSQNIVADDADIDCGLKIHVRPGTLFA